MLGHPSAIQKAVPLFILAFFYATDIKPFGST
jgi:hypothetical protein